MVGSNHIQGPERVYMEIHNAPDKTGQIQIAACREVIRMWQASDKEIRRLRIQYRQLARRASFVDMILIYDQLTVDTISNYLNLMPLPIIDSL